MEQDNQSRLMPAVLQWKLGKKLVTVINDSQFAAGEGYFTHLPEGGVSKLLQNAFRPAPPVLTTNVFLIQSEEHPPVLIDVGMGDKYAPAINGQLLYALSFIGIKPEDIGIILLTHLHGDHYFGLVDQDGRKNFPNAKVWVSDTEMAHWFDHDNLSEQDQQNVTDARLALQPYEKLNTKNGEMIPGITPVPLPGHTPGQTGFLLQSDEEDLLFCADLLSLPAIQAALPNVGFATDVNHDVAVQTRISTLQDAADRRLLLAGAHFEYSCLHYVEKHKEGFRLVPKQWL